MRLYTLLICAVGLMAVGCQPTSKNIHITRLTDSGFYNCIAATATDTVRFCVEKRYDIHWPKEAPVPLQEALAKIAFGLSDIDWEDACMDYVEALILDEGETLQRAVRVDHLTDCKNTDALRRGMIVIDSRKDKELYCFEIKQEQTSFGSSKGVTTAHYVTYNNKKHKIVTLNDLVDSAQLGPVIVRALEDLEVNKDADSVLKEAYREAVPVTGNFYIDSSRSTLQLVYQPGEIAPEDCGIQTVVVPVFWLSKHLKLTHYGKDLFGPGSSN